MLHYILTSYFSCMFVHIGVLLGEVAEMLCGGIALARCGFDWRWAYLQTKIRGFVCESCIGYMLWKWQRPLCLMS
jgi:hypothetical protein